MIAVYVDNKGLEHAWVKISEPYKFYYSMWEYEASDHRIKIAFSSDRLGVDYDIGDPIRETPKWQSTEFPKLGTEDKINRLSRVSNAVFVFDSEMHSSIHIDMWDQCHHDNVYWILPGTVNSGPAKNNIIGHGHWFLAMTGLYTKQLADKLNNIQYQLPKPKYFDALLGRPRPHRDFLYKSVIENNLQDKIIMSYIKDENFQSQVSYFFKNNFIWESGCSPIDDNEITGTHNFINYNGIRVDGLSKIIPIDTFNKTAYSIVAETNLDNRLVFCTEKIVKPILSRRLFVVFSGYKFLEYLHQLGFKTFDNVIDESYDLIQNDHERYTQAFEQVKKLCEIDQKTVFDLVQERLEHNYEVAIKTDWVEDTMKPIKKIIDSIIYTNQSTTSTST